MNLLLLGVLILLSKPHTANPVKNETMIKILNPAERALINKQQFTARPSNYENFYKLYEDFASKHIPLYITIDPFLHVSHVLYDYSLRSAELNYFYPTLVEITKFMVEEMRKLTRVKHKEISHTARRNLAYFEVALKLLDENFTPDPDVSGKVEHDIRAIEEHEGFDSSYTMGIMEDFSQYVPRGHYTRNETFKRYFKAMMWYGRMSFYLSPRGKKNLRNIQLTRQAILITKTLMDNPKILEKWKSIYEPTAYMVGKSDDLSPLDLIPLVRKHFPQFPIGFHDDTKIVAFMQEVTQLRPPRIFSTYYTDREKPRVILSSFRFMGQRFVPDSYMFQNLVYTAVGTREKPRLFPKGLDILAVLNIPRAEEILRDYYNEFSYFGYKEMLDSLRLIFSKLSRRDWHQNAYYHWLYIIYLINITPEGIIPMFMVTPAYQDKLLVTSLGYWAELRHDTILYAKQSYTAKVTAVPPERKFSKIVYVEPLPEVYKELQEFADSLRIKLTTYNILDPVISSKLESFSEIVSKLEEISLRELDGKSPTPSECEELYKIGTILQQLVRIPGKEKYTSQTDKKMALVADVHTDPNSKKVLEVAVGNPLIIYAVIPYNGDNYLAAGGMFSYFEFTHPMDDRLTDEKWQNMQPYDRIEDWMRSFVITK